MSNQNQMNQSQFKHVPAGTGPAYCGPGDRITFLITGAETGGAFFMAEVSVVPGGGPPPHIHSREDESFYVQQGTLAVQVGDKALNVSAGDFVHMPRGVVHSFKNVGQETAKATDGGHAGGTGKLLRGDFLPGRRRRRHCRNRSGGDCSCDEERSQVRFGIASSRWGTTLKDEIVRARPPGLTQHVLKQWGRAQPTQFLAQCHIANLQVFLLQ